MKAHILAAVMLCLTTSAWAQTVDNLSLHYPYPGKIVVTPNMVMDNMTTARHCIEITTDPPTIQCSEDSGLNWVGGADCLEELTAKCISSELDIRVWTLVDQPDHYQDK